MYMLVVVVAMLEVWCDFSVKVHYFFLMQSPKTLLSTILLAMDIQRDSIAFYSMEPLPAKLHLKLLGNTGKVMLLKKQV